MSKELKKLEEDEKTMKGYLQYLMGEIKYYEKRRDNEKLAFEQTFKIVENLRTALNECVRPDVKEEVMPPFRDVQEFLKDLKASNRGEG